MISSFRRCTIGIPVFECKRLQGAELDMGLWQKAAPVSAKQQSRSTL